MVNKFNACCISEELNEHFDYSLFQRAQVELGQVRQEIERRLQEKEDEFNNARKVHQKTAEQMQAHLESECKAKAEVLRTKKKLEADVQVICLFV